MAKGEWVMAGCLLLVAIAASPVQAQMAPEPTTSPFGGQSEDRILPKTSYPLGRADLVARGLATAVKIEQVRRDLCEKFGCIIVRNQSRGYRVTGFYVKMPDMLGSDRWGPNQLDDALQPQSALMRVKTGGPDACALPVRFELVKRKTKQRVTIISNGNFCSTPRQNSLLQIRIVEPTVTVEPAP